MRYCLILISISLLAQQPAGQWNVEREQALGRSLLREMESHSQQLSDPSIAAYVRRIGDSLAAPRSLAYQFDVRVVEGREPLPIVGGTILVPAAFFLTTRDESEFAAMIAHAMGHLTLRHGFRPANAPANAGVPLIYLGGWQGVHGAGALLPMGLAASYRQYELEADRFGAELLRAAGYDAAALRRYLERTLPTQIAEPALSDRVTRLANVGADAERFVPASQEFLDVQEAVRRALSGAPKRVPPLRR